MTLKDQMANDAANVFGNSDEFAETVIYTPYGGTAKTLGIVVVRERLESMGVDRNRTVSKTAEIYVPNDSTNGVTSVNRGHDTVQFAPYLGGVSVTWVVEDVINHDDGMWRLLVRR